MIYLDNAATTPVNPEVLNVMLPYFTEKWYNPSALYSKAKEVRKDIDRATSIIKSFINAKYDDEICYTSGGSEGNCWAITGFINYYRNMNKDVLIISTPIEHKSIQLCLQNCPRTVEVCYVDIDSNGSVVLNSLENILKKYFKKKTILCSIQFANNEIGTIQNMKQICAIAHQYGAIVHSDAVQAFGQIYIDIQEINVDLLSISGHKINAPKGIGFLYIKRGTKINPLIYGTQFNGMRGGTENVPYIMGLAKAVELCRPQEKARLISIRNYFIEKLKKQFNCKINGHLSNRLPNNINVTFNNNITGEALIYMLDMDNIMISAGSACNAHTNKPSYVLKAIGLSDVDIYKSARFSLFDNINETDVDIIMRKLTDAIKTISI